jgi:hypothetical protein
VIALLENNPQSLQSNSAAVSRRLSDGNVPLTQADILPSLTDEDIMQYTPRWRGKSMAEVPDKVLAWFWRTDGLGFCDFGVRRGYPGQLAEYIERRFEAKRQAMPEKRWPKYLHQRARVPLQKAQREQ